MERSKNETIEELELGFVICKECSTIIATLPTNGVKRFFGECKNAQCKAGEEGDLSL